MKEDLGEKAKKYNPEGRGSYVNICSNWSWLEFCVLVGYRESGMNTGLTDDLIAFPTTK
jgi:hypothetical protein